MVERVSLTPSNMTVRNASGGIVFSSDNRYLKQDASGVFRVGGYSRSPVIAGQSTSISDKTNCGYFTGFVIPQGTLWSDLQGISLTGYLGPGNTRFAIVGSTPGTTTSTQYSNTVNMTLGASNGYYGSGTVAGTARYVVRNYTVGSTGYVSWQLQELTAQSWLTTYGGYLTIPAPTTLGPYNDPAFYFVANNNAQAVGQMCYSTGPSAVNLGLLVTP